MADNSLGTARVDIVVDISKFQSSIERAKNITENYSDATQRAFNEISGAPKRATESFLKWAETIGHTTESQKLLNAAIKGVPVSIIEEVRQKLAAQRAEMDAAAESARKLGLAHQEALKWDAERTAQQAQNANQSISSLLGVQTDEDQARIALRRQQATEGLTLALLRQEAAEQELARSLTIDSQEEAARLAIRRQEAIEGLTLALQREEFAEQELNSRNSFEHEQEAARLAYRRQEATAALIQVIEQEDEAERRLAAQNTFVENLKQQADAIGKTRSELLGLKAAELGVSEQAEPFLAKMRQQEDEFRKAGASAGQLKFAMRQLPMQFTDIAVSLATGQAPMYVLLQQGGQLKDVFGGIGPAAEAMGKYILDLVNPFTVAVAAIGGLAYAVYDASKSMETLSIATAKGGNFAGSAESLYALANSLDAISGIRLGPAEAAVASLAESGKLSGENFKLAAEASAKWASVTGEGADKIAEKFEHIADSPLQAMLDGTLKVTDAEYKQISALLEHGDKQEAVNVATKIFYDTVNDNSATVQEHLTGLSAILNEIKDEFSGETRGVANFIDEMAASLLRATQAAKTVQNQGAGFFASRWAALKSLTTGNTGGASGSWDNSASDNTNLTTDQIKANEALQKEWDNSGTKAEKLSAKVDKLNASLRGASASWLAAHNIVKKSDGTFSGTGYDRLVKGLDKSKQKSTTALENAQSADDLATFKAQLAQEKNDLENGTKELKAQYDARKITVEQYYTQVIALTKNGTDQEAATIQKEIDYLSKRNVKGKDALVVQKQIKDLESQLAQVRADGASKVKILGDEEDKTLQQRAMAIKAYKDALDLEVQATQDDIDAQVRQISMGDQEYERSKRLNDVRTEAAKKLQALAKAYDQNKDAVVYESGKDNVKQWMDQQVKDITDGYARIDEARSEWQNGAKAGMENYIVTASNAAEQTKSLFSDAFSGAEDALVQFVKTGKLSFSSLVDSILSDLTRMLAKQGISTLLGSLLGSSLDTSSVSAGMSSISSSLSDSLTASLGVTKADGGYISGPGTSTSDSIPARLSNGEYVIKADAVSKYGSKFFDGLNAKKFASGGAVGYYTSGGSVNGNGSSGTPAPNVQINVNNQTGTDVNAEVTDTKWDGEGWVTNIALKAIASSKGAKVMKSKYGVSQKGYKSG